jgi:uncharacterized protein (DUF362 family)
MTRRSVIVRVLGIALVVVVGLVLFRWRFVVRQMLTRPAGPPIAPVGGSPASTAPATRVVLATGGSPRELVEACLERLDADRHLTVRGKTVLVKPNVVSGAPAPTTTSPEVVEAVCEWLARHGAGTVWVGDMAAVMSAGTPASMKACGIEAAARRAGAVPVHFEEHGWVPVRLPGARHLDQVPVSEFVVKADLVLNLPVIKSHRWATYSVCLKNFVGATHARYRPYLVDSAHWEEVVSELNLAYRPHLNLVDGTRVMYAGGPWRGDEAPLGVILAGPDRVACDAVAVALMKTFPGVAAGLGDRGVWDQRQIRHARALGLGAEDPRGLALDIHHHRPPPAALVARLATVERLLREPPTAPISPT